MIYQLVSHLLIAAIAAVSSCQTSITKPPLLWLADLRSGSLHVDSGNTPSLVTGPGHRIIRFEEGATPVPVSIAEKLELEKSGLRYFDETEVDIENVFRERIANDRSAVATKSIPARPFHQAQATPAIATLSQANLKTGLSALTSYKTRYYRSATSASAANALLSKLQSIASSASGTGGPAFVTSFAHSWGMLTIIAKIAGTNDSGAITIVGGHLDSINQSSPSSGTSNGADDNGSGCVNLIEAFRKLVAARFKPTTPVEFRWYSGEEVCKIVYLDFSFNNPDCDRLDCLDQPPCQATTPSKSINAYTNLDMMAWLQTGTTPQIGFVADRTNTALTAFSKKVVTSYRECHPIPQRIPLLTHFQQSQALFDNCGYACSHASNSLGCPAVYPFESITQYENPNIHTAQDTTSSSQFSFAHAHEFTKLVVAFVMELAL